MVLIGKRMAQYGLTAALSLAEEFDVTALAVRFVVLLFESAFVQLFKAKGANKMLRVKLLAHGCDTAAGYGLLTAGAQ